MKYELTDETHPYRPALHRIRALRDIPEVGVKSGDLGGWVESESNLSKSGNAWVSGTAQVYGDAQVSGTAQVSGEARVFGNAQVYGNAQVFDTAQVFGNAQVYGTAEVFGNTWVSGTARVYGARHVATVGPVGSENRTVTIYRDKDGTARIVAGCWTGTPNELAERITDAWSDANPADRKAWASDYKTVIKLARKREKGWNR